MSPARKRSTKGAKKTTKKATRKAPAKKATKAAPKKKATSAKSAAARKTTRKAAKKTAKAEKRAARPSAPASAAKPSKRRAKGRAAAKPARRPQRQGVAQPLESAEKKPGLGAKWACFKCGAKFYDLNRPDPICPKCQTDQREQPAKTTVPVAPPPSKRPSAQPISRLLDEEDGPDAAFDENSDAESAAELDIGKFDDENGYLDDADFDDDTDD